MTTPRRTRRHFLQSGLFAGGLGASLPEILRLQSQAADLGNRASPTSADTAVIQVWLGGGPSQFETFDPKPNAPVEIRGPYSSVATQLPGVRFCEKLSRTAGVLDRAAVIRTVTHATNGHFVGGHWCSTGYPGVNNTASHPSAGAVASQFRGSVRPGMPPYVLLSEEQTRNLNIGEIMGRGHLAARHAPLSVLQDPFHDEFDAVRLQQATSNFTLADDVTLKRMDDRHSLLTALDRLPRNTDALGAISGLDQFNHAAIDMVTSGVARKAFDLSLEPQAIRDQYGRHRWGQMGLLARRLVEAGVTFVTINTAPDSLCWDWHLNIVHDNRPADGSEGPSRGMDVSGPPLDQMLSALITDLYQRGLDKKVLLVVWGEFGRTPRINKTGGRDHWGSLMSILMAGGGLKVGQVIGISTNKGETPLDRPVAPTDVLTMIYRHLGIDPRQHTLTPQGRPVPILPESQIISELI